MTSAQAESLPRGSLPPGISWVGIAAAAALGIAGYYIGTNIATRLIEDRTPSKVLIQEIAIQEKLPLIQSNTETLKGNIDTVRKQINAESLQMTIDQATLSAAPADARAIRERITTRKLVLSTLDTQLDGFVQQQVEMNQQLAATQNRIDQRVRDLQDLRAWQERGIQALSILAATVTLFVLSLPIHRWRYLSSSASAILAGSLLAALILGVANSLGIPGVVLAFAIGVVIVAGRYNST